MSDSGTDYYNPGSKASFFSKLFFCWVLPIFKLGIKKDLKSENLYKPSPQDISSHLGDKLDSFWSKELKNGKNPSLKRAIFKMMRWPLLTYGLILFFQCIVLKLGHPILLAEFIKYFSKDQPYENHQGYILGSVLILVLILNQFISHHVSVANFHIGMRCKIACCSLMFRKILKLNKIALSQTSTEQVVNLMTNDVQRFETLFLFLHYIWITPIQVILAAYLMYRELGYAALVGLLFIVIQGIPILGFLLKSLEKLRSKIANDSDLRVKYMTEIILGIKTVKMYAWERIMEHRVKTIRKSELDYIKVKNYILGFMTSTMVFSERTSLFLALVIYAVNGNLISSYKVFSMAQYFNIVQIHMAYFLPMGVTCLAEANTSFKRIKLFLLLPEYPESSDFSEVKDVGSIELKNCKASWLPKPIIWTLSNINLDIKPGSLCIIVGEDGSGKSSLLQLLLKELPLTSGIMKVNGHISYTSENPWLFNASIRRNILFGKPNVAHIYNKVLSVCALVDDIENLPRGDMTNVGENGKNLSIGQRARINLARAVYSWADIYLLDDPLAAVDEVESNHIFENCILKYLKRKTRILVTHQMSYLEMADKIVLMKNGQISKVTTFEGLTSEELKELKIEVDRDILPDHSQKELVTLSKKTSSLANTDIQGQSMEEMPEFETTEKVVTLNSTYFQYFLTGVSIHGILFLSFLILLAQGVCNGGDLWLRLWTNTEENDCTDGKSSEIIFMDEDPSLFQLTNHNFMNISNETFKVHLNNALTKQPELVCSDEYSRKYYIYVYTTLIILTIFLTILRSIFFFKLCVNSSRSLHLQVFEHILFATMSFFNKTPSGKILNIFSKDIGAVDEILPRCLLDCIQLVMIMFGILIMIFIVSPLMIIPSVVLGALFILIRYIYMATARSLKQLEEITRSPLYSYVSSSMLGITTIRNCKAQVLVESEFDGLQDDNTSATTMTIYTSETFGFYLDIICIFFITIVTIQFFFYKNVVSGDVGLVVFQAIMLAGLLQDGVRQSTEVSNNMISVERILQYTKIDREDVESSEVKPHENWPDKGGIQIKNLTVLYGNITAIVNINLEIEPGEKIAIFGKVGAGKSSLVSALFRLVAFQGRILIDGEDTKEISLANLRKRISFIPQEPFLFSTNIRQNLNPEKLAIDEEIWSALEKVELKNTIDSLEEEVQQEGANFSMGKKLLLCIARAILVKNKIIVIDEPTANLDKETHTLIQKTIHKNFNHCTVLTIAHRLETAMNSDRVIVIDKGEVKEFDTPKALIKYQGLFSHMVRNLEKKQGGV